MRRDFILFLSFSFFNLFIFCKIEKKIFSKIFIFRAQELGARQQPLGANSVFQHSELMVNIILLIYFCNIEDSV
jgi:hypothetical protein